MKDNFKIGIFFWLSGATALIYEVVWARQLGLVFGTTVYAMATVLAIFFSGLGLGSWLFGKLTDGLNKPLRLYGLMEILIGIYALATPGLFKLVENWQGLIGGDMSFWEKSLIRFGLSFLILIIPTALMGGTLPVIIKQVSKNKSLGKMTAKFYGLNTLGAVLGVILAGFVLMPMMGISRTVILTAGINILIGVMVLKMAGKLKTGKVKATELVKKEEESRSEGDERWLKLVMGGLFGAGLAGLGLEVLWTRMLILVIGVSTYAFSIVLLTFLLGIGLGSFLIGRVINKIKAVKVFVWLEFFQGVLVILLIGVFGKLPFWYLGLINRMGWSFKASLAAGLGMTVLVLLLPTILMGMIFPVAVKIVGRGYKSLGESVGKIYFFNTLGGVGGSLLAGFVLVPWLGVQKSMVIMAGVYFLVALMLAKRKEMVVIFGGAILVIGWFLPDWNRKILSTGLYNNGMFLLKSTAKEFREYFESRELIYYKEGVSSLVGVGKDVNQLILLVNGKSQSGSRSDIKPQLMLGHLPMLLQANPKRALVIGLGTGMTLGAIEQYDELEEVVAVEIEPEVVEAAEYFKGVNNNALEDERLKIVIDDGRNYLLTTDKKFEVISSQPSNPWIKGMANLYTKEFFELAKAHLTEDGVMVQWMQINTLTSEDLRSFIATFQSVFPEVSIWETIYSIYLVGGNNSIEEIDMNRLGLINRDAKVRRDILRMGIDNSQTFLGHLAASGEVVKQWVERAKLHTDDWPFLEFNAPRSFYEHEETLVENLISISELRENSTNIFVNKNEYEYRGNIIKAEIAFAKDDLDGAKKYYLEAIKFKPKSKEAIEGFEYVNFLLRN